VFRNGPAEVLGVLLLQAVPHMYMGGAYLLGCQLARTSIVLAGYCSIQGRKHVPFD
jgi:hypothetical protein